MTTSKISLLDTNVLVYASDETSSFYQSSKMLREKGLKGEIPLCVSPQILTEFFAIITDPKRVNNPRTRQEALLEIEKYFHSKNILKIYSNPEIIEKVLDLLRRYEITRQEVFDLHLVAAMLSNSITRIYTYNTKDFSKFNEIEVLTP